MNPQTQDEYLVRRVLPDGTLEEPPQEMIGYAIARHAAEDAVAGVPEWTADETTVDVEGFMGTHSRLCVRREVVTKFTATYLAERSPADTEVKP